MEVIQLKCFSRQSKKALKKFSKSKKTIESFIKDLPKNYKDSDVIPGFQDFEVRKVRIGLPEYKIGKRGGFRLVFLCIQLKGKLIPLAIYKKGQYSSEAQVIALIKEQLIEVENELSADS